MDFEFWLTAHYSQLWYLICIASLFFFLLIENLLPLRDYSCPVIARFATNIGLLVVNSWFQKLILPIVPVTASLYFKDNPLVIFNLLSLSMPAKVILSILIIDFFGYVFHFLMHRFSLLWRIHYPHHTDMDFDATTNFRFHPFEAMFTACADILIIAVFGVPVIVVMSMSIIHIVSGFFTHWNINIPCKADKLLKKIIVTPNMHRIHHSANKEESMRNYGIIFSFWDRLFCTYLENPSDHHRVMALGMPAHRNPKDNMLLAFLWLPFRNPQMGRVNAEAPLKDIPR